ncbi:hypothetical protein [Paenibacillus hexagrammi]|uniref:Uncharacterized protein n=1 Tax=Paenibacillus hexagrammi TaxID=2908839 RepID=A0ABY3SPW4_9BACL|nr:hypothetical protein [Paenibacillus sp. YPD9-1]UJF35882.1 hypothetical protein L0M14_12840 [Paenibacillus sp. YPD9-1]
MIYGTKLIETDSELFAAALAQSPVLVWSFDHMGVYFQVDSGTIVKYTSEQIVIRSEALPHQMKCYSRETSEVSLRP